MNNFKLKVTSILIVIFILVLGVLLVEKAYYLIYPDRVVFYEYDDHNLVGYKKSLDTTKHINNKKIDIKTNSFGYRDEHELAPEDADILLLGDSNIAAEFVGFEFTLGEQLESLYQSKIRVLNMGLPGYGPDQSYLKYKSVQKNTNNKAIVFHIFADNDYGDILRNNIMQAVERYNDDYVLPLDPYLSVGSNLFAGTFLKLIPVNIKSLLYEGMYDNYYYPLSISNYDQDDRYDRWVALSLSEYDLAMNGGYTSWLGDHYDYGLAIRALPEMENYIKDSLKIIFTNLKHDVQFSKRCIVILIQPSEVDASNTIPWLNSDELTKRYIGYSADNLSKIAVSVAQDLGVSYINLYESFKGKDYYYTEDEFPGDNHWNEKGISVAATKVFDVLNNNNCLGE